jgi:hypothetical protein
MVDKTLRNKKIEAAKSLLNGNDGRGGGQEGIRHSALLTRRALKKGKNDVRAIRTGERGREGRLDPVGAWANGEE